MKVTFQSSEKLLRMGTASIPKTEKLFSSFGPIFPNTILISFIPFHTAQSRETFLICAFVIAGIILVILFSTTITALLANDFKLLIHNMQLFASGKYTLTEQEQMLSSRKDEIGMLHKGFNDMAVEINDLIEKNYVTEKRSSIKNSGKPDGSSLFIQYTGFHQLACKGNSRR